jgi:hypothetical protein
MSIKNPDFSLLGSFFDDEKEKPVYLFHRLFLRLEIQNQSWSRGGSFRGVEMVESICFSLKNC